MYFFQAKEIKRLFIKDMLHLPIDKRKDEIKKYFKLKFNEKKVSDIMEKVVFNYEYTIARLKKTMEDSPLRRQKIIELYDERDEKKKELVNLARENIDNYFKAWKHDDIKELLRKFFNDEEIFNEVTDNRIKPRTNAFFKRRI